MNLDLDIRQIVLGLFVIYLLFKLCNSNNKINSKVIKENYVVSKPFCKESADFCPRGYCKNDNKEFLNDMEASKHKYPCKKNFAYMGYDNPYIYPYNYNMNLNHPLDKYKYPEWIRQLSLTVENQFPGFIY